MNMRIHLKANIYYHQIWFILQTVSAADQEIDGEPSDELTAVNPGLRQGD
jgi:hypothetical protein